MRRSIRSLPFAMILPFEDSVNGACGDKVRVCSSSSHEKCRRRLTNRGGNTSGRQSVPGGLDSRLRQRRVFYNSWPHERNVHEPESSGTSCGQQYILATWANALPIRLKGSAQLKLSPNIGRFGVVVLVARSGENDKPVEGRR